MRWLTLILILAIAALQYPLWLGKGSWLKVWEVGDKIAAQNKVNAELRARNQSLDAEVRDLKQGYDAIEERARSELGMIKNNEVFYQVLEGDAAVQHNASTAVKPPQTQGSRVATGKVGVSNTRPNDQQTAPDVP